jgi:hypothetical protein
MTDRRPPSFFDDPDDDKTDLGDHGFDSNIPTQIDQQRGNFGGPDAAYTEAPTELPGRGGNAPYQRNADLEATQLPGGRAIPQTGYSPYGGGSPGVNETMLGDEDQDISPMAFLIVKRPLLRRGFVHTIRAEITKVGRHEGDIRLETDLRVSNPHARIRRSTKDKGEDSYVLIDMDSKGGTHVNGNRIEGRHVLIENDEVRIGEHVFVFKVLWD